MGVFPFEILIWVLGVGIGCGDWKCLKEDGLHFQKKPHPYKKINKKKDFLRQKIQ